MYADAKIKRFCRSVRSRMRRAVVSWLRSGRSRPTIDCGLARLMRAAPDRHRDYVCSPVAVGVDGARSFDAERIDGLHDRSSDRAGGYRHRALLLFAVSQNRFRADIRHALAGCGADDRMDLAGAIAQFPDRRGTSAGVDSRRDLALVPLSLGRASADLGSSSARANQSRCECNWGAADAGRRLNIGRDLSYLRIGLRLPRAGARVAMSALGRGSS